jgi:hypothetical protein
VTDRADVDMRLVALELLLRHFALLLWNRLVLSAAGANRGNLSKWGFL